MDEGIEDFGRLLVRHPNACISNSNRHLRTTAFAHDTRNDLNATFLGKLNRVTDEVRDKLPHTRGIGQNRLRQAAFATKAEIDAFVFRAAFHNRDDFAKDRIQPWRIILTATKDLPEEANLLTDEHQDRTMVIHGASLDRALSLLGDQGVCSVMIESGGRLFSHGLANDLIDEVVIYLAPIIGGGDSRLMPMNQLVADLNEVNYTTIGRDLRVTGFPTRRHS